MRCVLRCRVLGVLGVSEKLVSGRWQQRVAGYVDGYVAGYVAGYDPAPRAPPWTGRLRQQPPHFAADACRTGTPMWAWQQGWSVVSCQTAHGFADCFVGFVVVVVVFAGTVSAVAL